ncbi:6-bladed beta-propeller [Nitritalea halalkaliphila]|nr:6-bladed beta-propeller [Nitritalea halalkaliphila]
MTHFRALLLCICCLHIHFFSLGQKTYPTSAADASPKLKKITVRSKDIQKSFTVTHDNVSEYFIVPLEATEASLIGKMNKVIRHEKKIFVLDSDLAQTVFCFDLNGKFLFKLGRIGKGSGEYRELRDIVLDPITNEIGVLQGDKIIWYSTEDGVFTGYTTELENIVLDKVSLLDSARFIGYANNQCFSKENCSKFYSFTKDAEILNRYLPIEKQEKNLYVDYENPFSGGIYTIGFTHTLNDTIYTINSDDQMEPKFWIDFTDMAVKKTSIWKNLTDFKNWFNRSLKSQIVKGLFTYYETSDAIQFEFRKGTNILWGLYLKETNRLIMTDELISQRILVNNNNVGIYKDMFISYISGEFILQIKEYLSSGEIDEQTTIEILGKDVYNHTKSIEDIANPVLIFAKFKNDL